MDSNPIQCAISNPNLEPRRPHAGIGLFGSSYYPQKDQFDPRIASGIKAPDVLWAVDGWGEWGRWYGSAEASTSPGVRHQAPQIDASNGERWSGAFDPWESQLERDNGHVPAEVNIFLDPMTTLIDPAVFSSGPHNPFAFGDVAADDALFQPNCPSTPQPQRRRTTFSSDAPQDPVPNCLSTHVCLESAQEQQLRDIAMPNQKRSPTPAPDPQTSPQVLEPNQQSQKQASGGKRKRESSSEDLTASAKSPLSTSASPPPPFQKASHNVCEKRYRNKLSVKLGLLRDQIPLFRNTNTNTKRPRPDNTCGGNEAGNGEGEGDDLTGLKATIKSDKGTILSKAIEYISHLEQRNKRLASEDMVLQRRVDAFEKLARAGALGCRDEVVCARGHRDMRC
jgi:hypothetical protein